MRTSQIAPPPRLLMGPGPISADPRVLPLEYRSIAEDAEIQEPFELPVRLGTRTVTVAWAVLRPRPVVAEAR